MTKRHPFADSLERADEAYARCLESPDQRVREDWREELREIRDTLYEIAEQPRGDARGVGHNYAMEAGHQVSRLLARTYPKHDDCDCMACRPP